MAGKKLGFLGFLGILGFLTENPGFYGFFGFFGFFIPIIQDERYEQNKNKAGYLAFIFSLIGILILLLSIQFWGTGSFLAPLVGIIFCGQQLTYIFSFLFLERYGKINDKTKF